MAVAGVKALHFGVHRMAVKMLNEDWQSETSLKDALWKLQQNQAR